MNTEPIGILAIWPELMKRFAPKNLSGGVESRHAEPPCKHGDVSAEADLMPGAAHGLVKPDNDSGSSAPPARNLSSMHSCGSTPADEFPYQEEHPGEFTALLREERYEHAPIVSGNETLPASDL